MADPAWGKKRMCLSCGEPFYDLKKKNIECPKCGAAFSLAPPAKPKRPTPPSEKPKPADTSPIEPAEDKVDIAAKAGDAPKPDDKKPDGGGIKDKDDKDKGGDGDGAEADEKDDELIVDASDLGEDDDDMSEVKEHIDDGVEDKN